MNRLYPVGIQNFEKIRKNGYIYVDKTALLYQLVKTGQYYFLIRPRRFGKSLTISTLEAYFTGKRELFKGLDMEQLEKDWTVHPVLHMDLNTEKYDTEESLEHKLELTLKQWEEEYGSNPDEYSVATRFEGVIRRAALKTGCNVVILIDEYDKPILQTISKPELQTEYRNTLKAFYGALKSCDGYIRFAMLTGVTKFSKVSVFSDLNNLMDISMHACELLKVNYDGYHFCYKSAGMYNPFSLLNTFAKRQIGSYWFETGTPTYLVELMKLHHYNVEEIEHIVTSGFENYTLGFPNREVEQGFFRFLLPHYASVSTSRSPYEIQRFVGEVRQGDVDGFLNRLRTFFDDTPYELVRYREVHYQNILYIVFKLMGFHTEVEYRTSRGRVDLVLKTADYIYVMEFKLDGYAAPFAADGRKVIKVGVNFSEETKSIDKWIVA